MCIIKQEMQWREETSTNVLWTDGRWCTCALQTLRFLSRYRWQHSTFLCELTSWPPFWNYDVKSKIRLRQSMCIYLKNKFHPIRFETTEPQAFWRGRPIKKNNNNKTSSDMRSAAPDLRKRHARILVKCNIPVTTTDSFYGLLAGPSWVNKSMIHLRHHHHKFTIIMWRTQRFGENTENVSHDVNASDERYNESNQRVVSKL